MYTCTCTVDARKCVHANASPSATKRKMDFKGTTNQVSLETVWGIITEPFNFYNIFIRSLLLYCWTGPSLRLSNGPSAWSGRVEILYNNVWGTVCDDSWDMEDADVVCRELGLSTAEAVYHDARYGQGTGEIWLSDTQCRGNETEIRKCSSSDWASNTCNHSTDAGVYCGEHRWQCKAMIKTKS